MVDALHDADILTHAPDADQRFLRAFRVLSLGYPLLWLVGLGGFYWVLLGVAGAVYLLGRRRGASIALPLVVLVVLLLVSLPVGIVAFDPDPSRVVSFVGNVLVWIALVALLTLTSSRSIAGAVTDVLLVLGVAQGVVTAAAQLAYPALLPVPLLHSAASSFPSGLAAFASNQVYRADWLGELAYRSIGISGQATWSGATGGLAALVGLRAVLLTPGRRVLGGAAAVAGSYSLVLSLSRWTEIALVVAVVVGLLVAARRIGTALTWVLAAVIAIGAGMVLIGASSAVARVVVEINDAREGSADTRGAIYARTLELVQQLPLPIVGYGIKPKEGGLVASVATHSTYLGLLFRAGVIGPAALLLTLVVVLVLAVRAADPWAATLAAFVALWCALEDLDPGHLVPLGLVLAYAMVSDREASARPKTSSPPAPTAARG